MPRISTGTGDDGTTGLVGGRRVPKTSRRVEAYGTVDEVNDCLGVAAAHATRDDLKQTLRGIQEALFTLGADLAAPEGVDTLRITPDHVARLVQLEERLEAALPPLRRFVLPGGTPAAAHLQMARSIARRAERAAWALHGEEPVNRHALVFLNRLSDLLFLLAREENVLAGAEENQWRGKDG